jgi:hypothetical protein
MRPSSTNSNSTGAGTNPCSWPRRRNSRIAARPRISVVERVIVHIHPDEAIRERGIHPAGERHRVLHACCSVLETIANAFPQDAIDLRPLGWRDVFADDIAAERERKPCVRFPPFAEIAHLRKPSF